VFIAAPVAVFVPEPDDFAVELEVADVVVAVDVVVVPEPETREDVAAVATGAAGVCALKPRTAAVPNAVAARTMGALFMVDLFSECE
jgi:hypothetical protein